LKHRRPARPVAARAFDQGLVDCGAGLKAKVYRVGAVSLVNLGNVTA
jgi:hypothetical protein